MVALEIAESPVEPIAETSPAAEPEIAQQADDVSEGGAEKADADEADKAEEQDEKPEEKA